MVFLCFLNLSHCGFHSCHILTSEILYHFSMYAFLLIILVLKKFSRGSTYYKRKWIGNREACLIELRNFLINHNVYKNLELLINNEEWLDKPWNSLKKY